MREIKFRAWDEQNKIMHNDFQFIKSGEEGNDWIVFTSDKQKLSDKPHPLENPFFQQQLKIMQFTGLFDKNGKEIYEGDVINIKDGEMVAMGMGYYGPEEEYRDLITDVIYHGSSFSYFHPNGDVYVPIDYEINNIIALSNIYENPELLT